jgi:hypothetical protein
MVDFRIQRPRLGLLFWRYGLLTNATDIPFDNRILSTVKSLSQVRRLKLLVGPSTSIQSFARNKSKKHHARAVVKAWFGFCWSSISSLLPDLIRLVSLIRFGIGASIVFSWIYQINSVWRSIDHSLTSNQM